ncbi:hypothetical protein Tco_0941237 [Tanacetum coccineum]|uniref:Uncharacterized protein n=1 Tax=Tanacetum coccineum TaxID=301880 RepID=A0ABQ5DSN6_9ASTR
MGSGSAKLLVPFSKLDATSAKWRTTPETERHQNSAALVGNRISGAVLFFTSGVQWRLMAAVATSSGGGIPQMKDITYAPGLSFEEPRAVLNV